MIRSYHANTRPYEVSAIFYDGINHESVVNWLKRKGISAVYEYSSHCILAYRNEGDFSISLRPGMVLVVDYTLSTMTEAAFRAMYNVTEEHNIT